MVHIEMVDLLLGLQGVKLNVIDHRRPLEVEEPGVLVRVLYPSSLQQSIPQRMVPSLHDKHFAVSAHVFLPSCQVPELLLTLFLFRLLLAL